MYRITCIWDKAGGNGVDHELSHGAGVADAPLQRLAEPGPGLALVGTLPARFRRR